VKKRKDLVTGTKEMNIHDQKIAGARVTESQRGPPVPARKSNISRRLKRA
jgi:hypothetical protein